MSDRNLTPAEHLDAVRDFSAVRKRGHVIGLNLAPGSNDGLPPITIDGMPFRNVSDIAVNAAPGKGIRVTVTFNASRLGGISDPEPAADTPEFDLSMTYPEVKP